VGSPGMRRKIGVHGRGLQYLCHAFEHCKFVVRPR
jgi:hypothetical protein